MARKAANMSQERLGRAAGCSTSMIRLVESGYQTSLAFAERIADVLQIDVSEVPHK